jgi:hypothetical protein
LENILVVPITPTAEVVPIEETPEVTKLEMLTIAAAPPDIF